MYSPEALNTARTGGVEAKEKEIKNKAEIAVEVSEKFGIDVSDPGAVMSKGLELTQKSDYTGSGELSNLQRQYNSAPEATVDAALAPEGTDIEGGIAA